MSAEKPAVSGCESPECGAAPTQSSGQGEQLPARGARQTIRSAELLAGAASVDIEHLGQIYRLQTTRAGKLILTK